MNVKKILKGILNILFYLILALMIYVCFVVVNASRKGEQPKVFGYSFYIVLTGSMQPDIKPGDLVVVKEIEPEAIRIGDVITFANDNDDNVTTHRVKEVIESVDDVSFITQGDANNIEDKNPVKGENVQGRLVKTIPGLGKTVDFMKNNSAVVLASIIAVFVLIIIIMTVISGLKKEEVKELKK